MTTMEIQLPDEVAAKLETTARKLGLSTADLLRISVEEKLATLDGDFNKAARYVLEKNAELYKRLA